MLTLACSAAQASSEGCPAGHGGSGAVEWGINGSEQLASGFRSVHEGTPNQVLGLTDVRSVQAGFKFAVALRSNCTLVSWGTNNKEQLGNGNHLQAQNRPGPVVNLENVKEASVANAHSAALRYDGSVWTWGASEFGERGNGEKGFERVALSTEAAVARPRYEPVQVPGLEHVVQLASGGVRDFALLASGEVVAWGENQNGDLGTEQTGAEEEQCYGETHARTPVPCSTVPRRVKIEGHVLTGVERIAAGGESAYAVRNGGKEVLAWGENSKGQLGTGDTERHPTPKPVMFTPPSPVVEIEGGSRHVLARLQNGQVYAWGSDESGQLGFASAPEGVEGCGSHACAVMPTLVQSLGHVVQLSAGEASSLAVKEEEGGQRVIYSFGRNGLQEMLGLGESAPETVSTPTPIKGLPSVGGVSASSNIAHRLPAGRRATGAAAVAHERHRSARSALDRARRSLPSALPAAGHQTVEQNARTRRRLRRPKRAVPTSRRSPASAPSPTKSTSSTRSSAKARRPTKSRATSAPPRRRRREPR